MEKIKVAIVGYGNLGKGAEKAINLAEDMELVGIFTRREPKTIESQSKVYSLENILDFKGEIDVCILCGGSATDLRSQGPEIARHFNTVDSFDTHAKIPEYFNDIDLAAKEGNNLSIISTGWDPGIFSMNRLLAQSILPQGETHTFWGEGVSQGHSDAIRRIDGVIDATQYTVPIEESIERIKAGEKVNFTPRDKHKRICYVVAEDGADKEEIEFKIITMPDYFVDYNTTVHFISEEELKKNHKKMVHGGRVLRIGETSQATKQVYEFKLDLDSNPEFTSSINVAFARAVYKMRQEGKIGAITVFDVPISYLSNLTAEEQRAKLL
ncbi:diaminopimelate dehydrogenase [Anaerosphaera multitolerans]|uniref:Meso-diaminopimelate D-dehydrogenase n=1 Tax=Anaerosphaera multitolerans TaxID=2487351 RepID=A0A437S5Y5_9FIRM|nr:diaminopimelate dehydrogenase [Anaerosphaera multitolerans]RVU54453.1 diaminopimelate dehydrogenase [Anaerosphaera multitolerans]